MTDAPQGTGIVIETTKHASRVATDHSIVPPFRFGTKCRGVATAALTHLRVRGFRFNGGRDRDSSHRRRWVENADLGSHPLLTRRIGRTHVPLWARRIALHGIGMRMVTSGFVSSLWHLPSAAACTSRGRLVVLADQGSRGSTGLPTYRWEPSRSLGHALVAASHAALYALIASL